MWAADGRDPLNVTYVLGRVEIKEKNQQSL